MKVTQIEITLNFIFHKTHVFILKLFISTKLFKKSAQTSVIWVGLQVLQGCCLEIYSCTLLFHLFHFTVTWILSFLLNKRKSIRQHQTSAILITQIHPGHDHLATSGMELTIPDSTQWAWRKGGHALTLSAIGAPLFD